MRPDLNLLYALEALLDKGSVVAAARRMHLSAPAMSRTLARIRETTGDPIFVQSGRQLVPTPRARAAPADQGCAQAPPAGAGEQVDLELLDARFNVRANDIFIGIHAGRLLDAMQQAMPRATLCFVPEEDDLDDDALRSGRVDLFISASRPLGHEIRDAAAVFHQGGGRGPRGPSLFKDEITPRRLAPGAISASRAGARPRGRSTTRWPAWAWTGMWRWSCPPPAARCWRCNSDLILPLPEPLAWQALRMGMKIRAFELPLALDGVLITQAWHPRHQMAPAHQWLRRAIRELTAADRERPGPLPRAETGRASARPAASRRHDWNDAAHACAARIAGVRNLDFSAPGRLRDFSIAATEERRNMSTAQDTRPQSPAWPGAASRAWTLLQRLDIATPRASMLRARCWRRRWRWASPICWSWSLPTRPHRPCCW